MHTYIHTYIHKYIYSYTRTHTHTRTHAHNIYIHSSTRTHLPRRRAEGVVVHVASEQLVLALSVQRHVAARDGHKVWNSDRRCLYELKLPAPSASASVLVHQ